MAKSFAVQWRGRINKMPEFVEMLMKAKHGDSKSKEELLNMYRPLLYKEALVDGIFDEDLFQELCLVFLTCISRFNVQYRQDRVEQKNIAKEGAI